MKVQMLCGPPSPDLARLLAEFEEPFTYPLGVNQSFRITHGEDYSLFFRAQGQGACFVAQRQSRRSQADADPSATRQQAKADVLGVLGTSIRTLWMPDGSKRVVAYLGDLKITPQARGGLVLARLAQAAESWLRPKVSAAFSVVMGGTSLTPESYTNRAGIPLFETAGQLTILRLATRAVLPHCPSFVTTRETALACYHQLSRGRYACPCSDAAMRSQMTPVWLMHPEGTACGLLEDTRKAKRLIADDGSEMLSAHLSCFAYASVDAAVELLEQALQSSVAMALPGLFVAVAAQDAEKLGASLTHLDVHPAPANVFATGFTPGTWNINTSEI